MTAFECEREEKALKARASLEKTRRRLEMENSDNELIKIQGALYLVNRKRGRVLDIGRGVLFDLEQGVVTQPDRLLVEAEQRRRILHSSPSISMRIIQQALGADDGALPPLLPGGQGGGAWLPTLQEFEVKNDG